jgi:DNA-binding NarL/FixJ family response regulator
MSSVLVYSHEPLHVEGLHFAIRKYTPLEILESETDMKQLGPRLAGAPPPHLVLVDYQPGSGLADVQAVFRLRVATAVSPFIGVWGRAIPPGIAAQLLKAGARGIVSKTLAAEVQARAVEHLAMGELWFEQELGAAVLSANHAAIRVTVRESQLIAYVTKGWRNKAIGAELHISEGTCKVYLSRLYKKLGIGGRHELATWGLANGYAQAERPPLDIVPPGKAA